jgi:hypothetical protein
MPGLDVEAIADWHVGLQIGLWKCDTIGAGRVTAQIEIPISPVRRFPGILIEGGNAKSLSKNGVGAKQKIEAATDVPPHAF